MQARNAITKRYMESPVTLLSLPRRLRVAQGEESESRRQVRIGLAELFVALVEETAVRLLPPLDRLEQFAAPIVLDALGVHKAVVAQRRHRLAEGVVIIEQARLPHAGVLIERIMPANPVHRALDARVVLAHAGVQEALQPTVGHRPQ